MNKVSHLDCEVIQNLNEEAIRNRNRNRRSKKVGCTNKYDGVKKIKEVYLGGSINNALKEGWKIIEVVVDPSDGDTLYITGKFEDKINE